MWCGNGWFMIGDFNEITGNHEKKGGRRRLENSFIPFRTMLADCGMLEFPFKGNHFSWVGRRSNGKVQCCLDRAVGNEEWHNLFSHTNVEYLKLWGSDHRPVLARIKSRDRRIQRSFKFDIRCLGKPGFKDAVAEGWGGKESLDDGNVFEKILDEAQCSDSATSDEELALKWRLCGALRDEEIYWKQKSRATWMREGDRNTKYFHATTKQRRARNRIISIKDENGLLVETEDGIEEVATRYFQTLFTASTTSGSEDALRYVDSRVSPETNAVLSRDFSDSEIKKAVFSINPDKAPGSDGILDPRINQTNICLIPKNERPRAMSEFCPISLCNVSYKIISKVLCNHLKGALPNLISETQSAFVARRLITDNILLAQENFHALRTNPICKAKFVAIKTDMSKAYDRVEWLFLEALMDKLGFCEKWRRWIMSCISSVSYKVLLNGEAKWSITPSRGLRQGDPLSPFLFIILTEALISQLKGAEEEGRITGLKIAQGSPPISHLLFADDSLFFCKADIPQCAELLRIINIYDLASGQQLNAEKSAILFGSKVDNSLKVDIKRAIGIAKEGGMGMYLGLPEKICGSKQQVFSYGGLGFWDLKDFNIALLAKQLWRLLRYPDSLLARVLKGRYFRYSNPLEVKTASSPSFGWKSMMAAKSLLNDGLRKNIKSGFNTKVWSDNWIPTIPARPVVSRDPVQDPHLYVNHLIDFNTKCWRVEKLEELIDHMDIPLILGLNPSRTFQLDDYVWVHSKSGQYTVKSGYLLATLQNNDKEMVLEPSTTKLKSYAWKLQTSRKIQHFIWQAVSGCVSTCSRLVDRHCGTDRTCARCGAAEETINHVLFKCPPALQAWALSGVPSNPGIFPCDSLFANFDFLFWRIQDLGLDASTLQMIPWLVWYIWKARNEKVFNNRDIGPQESISIANAEAQRWKLAQLLDEEEEADEVYPSQSFSAVQSAHRVSVTCQVDGSWAPRDSFSGIGFYLEGSSQPLVGLKSLPRLLSPLHAELEALTWAMENALEKGFMEVHFETDCSELASVLDVTNDWPAMASELDVFTTLRARFSYFSLGCIPRLNNVRADRLAKAARARGVLISHVSFQVPEWIAHRLAYLNQLNKMW
ncbi:PREDICTED: uncharacterized protein LOC104753332 [Camelina sativa]|uniref:Uncharacterized protein LOC104753332 n=1 Tax=Camelina sativa TaxID=90675 RepID=A0ABM0WNZ9_CAMSA|nr:PREDICTED: uncharacterized protein LOC104753332 [Camelina sativa]